MRVGEKIAFWWDGEVVMGTVSTVDHITGALMAHCPTSGHGSVMVREEDVIQEEDDDEGF